MGDLAEDFKFMKEARLEHRKAVEPDRFDYAVREIHNSGHLADRCIDDDKKLKIDGYIDFWPFTGWWSGKGIGSGRGIQNLLEKLAQS